MNLLFRLSVLVGLIAIGIYVTSCSRGIEQTRRHGPLVRSAMQHRITSGVIEDARINEASGLAVSKQNEGIFWIHNDSGDEPRVFAVDQWGHHIGAFNIADAKARDWEDMTLGAGPEPDVQYLYLGDIGDNQRADEIKEIYRVREPGVDPLVRNQEATLPLDAVIRYRYPDGIHNSETLMLDPATRDLYILSKDQSHERVYRLPFPQDEVDIIEAELVGTIHLQNDRGVNQQAVAGEISPSGLQVIIKSYDAIYLWERPSVDVPLFSGDPIPLPYVPEPQGEAIAWALDESGYFTVSEERGDIEAVLYFYPFSE